MRTLIAIPCMETVQTEFARSLVNMRTVGTVQYGFLGCSLVYHARKELSKIALQTEADYVLWIDSDMNFGKTLMEDFLKAIEGRDIVSGICHMRHPPYRPVLWKKLKQGILPEQAELEPYDDYPQDGIFEVEGCGFGAVMMRTSVIRKVAETFHETFGPIPGFGEDLSFCLRARNCGFKIHADPGIQVGHKGSMIVTDKTFRAFAGWPDRTKERDTDADGMQAGDGDHGSGV